MTKRILSALLGFAVLALAANLPAAAEEKNEKRDTDKNTADFKNLTDAQFAMMASASGLAEVNLSRLAVDQATRPEVKDFARHMIADHSNANTLLIQVANTRSLTLATRMDEKHQALADRLVKVTGAEFDRDYMTQMVQDHEQAVALFEAESRNGKDADLKAFAAKTLPTIKMHLEMARKLADKDAGKKDR